MERKTERKKELKKELLVEEKSKEEKHNAVGFPEWLSQSRPMLLIDLFTDEFTFPPSCRINDTGANGSTLCKKKTSLYRCFPSTICQLTTLPGRRVSVCVIVSLKTKQEIKNWVFLSEGHKQRANYSAFRDSFKLMIVRECLAELLTQAAEKHVCCKPQPVNQNCCVVFLAVAVSGSRPSDLAWATAQPLKSHLRLAT